MKLKKRYMLIPIILLIALICFYITKNDIKILNIKTKNYKVSNITFNDYRFPDCVDKTNDGNDDCHCDAYYTDYKNITNALFNEIVTKNNNTNYFQIVKAENTNIGYAGEVYIKNGCAIPVNNFIDEYISSSGNTKVCDTLKSNATSRKSIQETYNESECITKFGYEKIKPQNSCSIEWDQDDSDGFEGAFFKVNGTAQPIDYYIDNCGCDRLEKFIANGQKETYENKCGVTLPQNGCQPYEETDSIGYTRKTNYWNGTVQGESCNSWVSDETDQDGVDNIGAFYNYKGNENNSKCYYDYQKTGSKGNGRTCNYIYDETTKNNLYLVNGCSWNISSYIDKCADLGETKCGDTNFKNFLLQGLSKSNWLKNHIDAYNSKCSDKINYGTINVKQNGGYGLECSNWNTPEAGMCSISAEPNQPISGPDISKLMKYGTQRFIGWSTSESCEPLNITNNTFTASSGTATYYACYEESESDLFKSDGSKKTGETFYKVEEKTCSQEVENTGGINVVPMKKVSTYIKNSYNTITVDNPYCNVLCTDTIDIYYPNIYQTIPAGQTFELLNEPEIHATRKCQSQFNYSRWENAYKSAINDELSKLDKVEEAEAYYNATLALNPTGSTYDCGPTESCNPHPCASGIGTCYDTCYTKQTKSDSETKYYYDHSGTRQHQTATFSSCGSTDTSDMIENAEEALKTAKSNYINAVNARLKFEQYNLQCYTILDSDKTNNTNINYTDIFNTNYDTVNELSSTYQVNTEKVIISPESYATKNNYFNYIINKTSSATNKITENNLKNLNINNGINTKSFYAVYPSLSFTYDNGSNGEPTNILNNSSPNYKDDLLRESYVKKDTGSYTTINENNYIKETNTANISKSFNLTGSYGTYINFNAYTSTKTYREVKYSYTFHEGTEFFASLQSGAFSTSSGINKVSLSKKTEYTIGEEETQKLTIKNHVYPVSLKAVSGHYKLKFNLIDETGNYLKEYMEINTTQDSFTCSYNITNDTLTLSGDKENYKDLKSNTIFRSIATNELDPNNRSSVGKLGENWINAKGLSVKKQIENTEGESERNTYNPDNLEYSFTLTPTLIQAIKEYNKTTNYDDFNLTCATEDGRECVSEFLTNLSNGKVKIIGTTTTQSNYININSWGEDELKKTRKTWKYFIPTGYDSEGKIVGEIIKKVQTSKPNINGTYKVQALSLKEYTELYKKWGVLP